MPLPSPSVPPLVRAPVRAVQFVVELVGPRTVPAAQAMELLRPDWRGALGGPELWAMRPADTAWNPLRAAQFGSYDSIALAWDLVTPLGEMSASAAGHLVATAERFAGPLGRRAIPLAAPGDVPAEVRRLRAAQDGLDAGTSVLLIAPQAVAATEFGRELERQGLRPFGDGEWGWFGEGHPEPLFAATPFEAPVTDGLTLGFRLARCPDPNVAIEGLFRLVDELARTGLAAFDEDRRPLVAATREALRQGAGGDRGARLGGPASGLVGGAEGVRVNVGQGQSRSGCSRMRSFRNVRKAPRKLRMRLHAFGVGKSDAFEDAA